MSERIAALAEKIATSPAFLARLDRLEKHSAQRRLAFEPSEGIEADVPKLLLQASAVALSSELRHTKLAQKINALVHESANSELNSYAVQLIASRLGNFPVVSDGSTVFGEMNLVKKLGRPEPLGTHVGADLLDGLASEEQASRVTIKDKIFHFNAYQREILEALAQRSLVSFSAPTSFGKSFVVRCHIAKLFVQHPASHVLIIVPTRALIDDFFGSLSELKTALGLKFSIHSHARTVPPPEEPYIFILTQERLSFLLSKNPDFVQSFQHIYCDEAHHISRGYRGFVLRDVLKRTISLCGVAGNGGSGRYIFSSPIIKNPQYYKEKLFAGLPDTLAFHKEIQYSPVEKNIHFVEKGDADCKYLLFKDSKATPFHAKLIALGSRTFPARTEQQLFPEPLAEEEASIRADLNIVLGSRPGGGTILFTPAPMTAHKYAYVLSAILSEDHSFQPEQLRQLERYIKDHYHESFGILSLLKKGVGLHYGPMPLGLRRVMVDLFERGHIKFLICTSTLLEGVNLPAKNIFLFSPKYTRERHTSLSFWNLIGRAGRVTYGLSGNVFLLGEDPAKYKKLLEEVKSEIEDPENEVLKTKARASHLTKTFLVPDERFSYVNATQRDDIEYLIYALLQSDRPDLMLQRLNLSPEEKVQIHAAIIEQRDALTISRALCSANPGLDPRLQDQLFIELREMPLARLDAVLSTLTNPFAMTAAQLTTVLGITAKTLRWPEDIERVSNRTIQWLHEQSISTFIGQRIRHIPGDSPASHFERIDSAFKVLAFLEKELSFKSPKYLKCFFDIALSVSALSGRNVDENRERVDGFLFALESGVSTSVGKFLFERGISRTVAVRASEIVGHLAPNPVTLEFFTRTNVRALLRTELSRIAFEEIDGHLTE